MQLLQKENVLILIIVVCALLYWKGKQITKDQRAQEWIKFLPMVGSIAYGFNALFQLA